MPISSAFFNEPTVHEREEGTGSDPVGSTPSDVNAFLEKQRAFIVTLVRQKVPSRIVHPDVLKDEIDELTQTTLIKFWLALQKRKITSPKGYIRSIVRTQVVDMVRRYQPLQPLPLDEEGEGIQDPAQECEQEEGEIDWIERIVGDMLALPPRQQCALICALKDHLEENHPLLRILREHGIDIEGTHWPQDRDELQSLQSSLSVARKKLRAVRDRYSFT